MTVGGSIFLIAVGAILRYAVTDSISGVDLATIGLILMIAGIVGLVIGLFMYASDATHRLCAARRARARTSNASRSPSRRPLAFVRPMVAAVRDARHERGRRDRRPAVARRLRARPSRASSRSRARARTATSSSPTTATARPPARCAASRFGATGWIGALGVAPEARRRGVGRALTEAAIARLHERGAGDRPALRHRHGPPALRAPGLRDRGRGHRVARDRRRDPAPACTVRRLREDDRAAVARARPRGDRRGARQPCSTRCTRSRASPPSARASSPAGRRRRPTAPASPSAPATTRPASR